MSTPGYSMGTATGRLLRQVAHRARLAAIGRRGYLFLLVLAGLYALAFLASRALGLIPDWSQPLTLLAVPAVALLLGLLLHRRPTPAEAARLADTQAGAHDLFLTTVLLGNAPGEFKPIVLRQAEAKAPAIAPHKAVPYHWQAQGRNAAAAMAVLLAGVLFLPQLDPFGREKKRQEQAQRRRAVAEAKKETELRLAALKKSDPKAATSEEARRAIEELKATFNQMNPREQQGNLKRLTEVQKNLGDQWRKRSEERLKNAFDDAGERQQVGAASSQKAERWKRKLQRGDPSEIKKEIQDVRQRVERALQSLDRAEQKKLREEARQQLNDLSGFFAKNASSKSLQDALQRVLEQLAAAENRDAAKEAMKGAQQALDLTDAELEALAQALRDLQAVEGALKAAQLAKQLNQLKALDGKDVEGLKDLDDYAAFYKKLLDGT